MHGEPPFSKAFTAPWLSRHIVVCGGADWDAKYTPSNSLGYIHCTPGARAIRTFPHGHTAGAPARGDEAK
jgi:hypothetical protein